MKNIFSLNEITRLIQHPWYSQSQTHLVWKQTGFQFHVYGKQTGSQPHVWRCVFLWQYVYLHIHCCMLTQLRQFQNGAFHLQRGKPFPCTPFMYKLTNNSNNRAVFIIATYFFTALATLESKNRNCCVLLIDFIFNHFAAFSPEVLKILTEICNNVFSHRGWIH